MSPAHVVRTAADATWGVPPALEGHAEGFRRWTVDEAAGAVHTGSGSARWNRAGGSTGTRIRTRRACT